jgi:hypothetical protein
VLAILVATLVTHRQVSGPRTVKYVATSLPQNQEWKYTGASEATAFVKNRILFARNDRKFGQDQRWERSDVPLDFTTRGKSFVLDLNIKINCGGWLTNLSGLQNWRTGFLLGVTDANGNGISFGLGEDRVRITDELDNSLTNRSTDFIPVYAAGDFHTFHLTIKDRKCNLTIDSMPTVYPLNIVGVTGTGLQTKNRVIFYNYSLLTSDISLVSLSYTQKG